MSKSKSKSGDSSYSVALLSGDTEVQTHGDIDAEPGQAAGLADLAKTTMKEFARGGSAMTIRIIEDDEKPHDAGPFNCGPSVGEVVYALIVNSLICKGK